MDKGIKQKIADIAGVHPATVYLWISDNKPNSDLTKTAIIQLISEETGLTEDQILESEKEAEAA